MNLRVVRKKIKSVKNVKKITKAMQMVSAVKMKKAQLAELESRPYRDGLTSMINHLSQELTAHEIPLMQIDTSQAKRELVILVTSNKGLAGAFNMNIFRFILNSTIDFKKADFIIIGQKGAQYIARVKDTHIIANFTSNYPVHEASAIFEMALEKFKTGQFKHVSVIYNRFISTMRSEVVHEMLLPVDSIGGAQTQKVAEKRKEYLIEPQRDDILEQLIMSFIEQKIRGAIVSSSAVEHSARMMAMKNATDNAGELVGELTLLSNRLRQEKITYELLDMITAKESVDVS